MEYPKVSILIPAFNSEKYIADTIESCISQTYPNIEIIIVDDGSRDNTLNICERYCKKYSKIKVFSQNHRGACYARNFAFLKSSGDYIMYLDADDLISLNKIEIQIKQILESKCDISVSSWSRYYDHAGDSNIIEPKYCAHDYDNGLDLLVDLWEYGEMYQTSCYVVPRSIIKKSGGWVNDLLKNQDGEFFSRILMKAGKIGYCPQAKVFYRTGDYDSVSKGNSYKKIEALLRSFELYEVNVMKITNSLRVKRGLARNYALFRYLYHEKTPDLSEIAEERIRMLGVSTPYVGTFKARLLERLIGFNNFLKIRNKLRK